MSDLTRLEDFNACQQYFSTLIQTTLTQAKAERHVGAVDTHGGGGGGPKSKSPVDKINGGECTDAQFYSLSRQEKDRIKQYRVGLTKAGKRSREPTSETRTR
jgi:hypothetical protein